jgi:hypothetical protein
MMKKIIVLALALGLVIGVAGMSRAAVTVGGNLWMDYSYGVYSDDWSASNFTIDDSFVAISEWNNQWSSMSVAYSSDDKKFGAFVNWNVTGTWNANTIDLRQARFYYDWGGGRVTFGQKYDVMEHFWPSYTLLGDVAIGYGKAYFDRREAAEIRWGDKYRFEFSLIRPIRGDVWSGVRTGEVYHTLPAVSGAAELNFGNVMIQPWVRWEYTVFDDGDDSDGYTTVDYGISLNGEFGLIGVTANVSYGINTAQMAPLDGGTQWSGVANPTLDADGDVDDNHYQWNYWAELRIADLYIGAGGAQANRDDWDEDPSRFIAWIGYAIPFGEITFRPEIIYKDNGETPTDADLGNAWYFGVSANLAF